MGMGTIYEVRVAGESRPRLLLACDLAQASAPIYYCVPEWENDPEAWAVTQYQTADARHDEHRAAALCRDLGGDESWREDDEIEVVARKDEDDDEEVARP